MTARASTSRRLVSRLGLAVASFVVALVVAELVVRKVYDPVADDYYVWKPHREFVFSPLPGLFPGISGEARFIANAQGIRGDELAPEDRYRILCMGASTTECNYLDQDVQWPHLVQDALRASEPALHAWVGNAGRSGLTTRGDLVQFRHLAFEHLGVNAILLLVGINDLQLPLIEDAAYDPRFLDLPGAEGLLLPTAFESFPEPYSSGLNDLANTALWRLVRRTVARATAPKRLVEDRQGSYVAWMRRHRKNARRIRTELPDLAPALAEYARNVTAMIAIARAKHIRLVALTQPTVYRPDLPPEVQDLCWFGWVDYGSPGEPVEFYSLDCLARGMALYNETLRRVCREQGVECLDLAAVVSGKPELFYDDCHFTIRGAHAVADEVARSLRERAPFGAKR